jgi:hypothetical protein
MAAGRDLTYLTPVSEGRIEKTETPVQTIGRGFVNGEII